MAELAYRAMRSPVGTLHLVASERGVVRVSWDQESAALAAGPASQDGVQDQWLRETERQLREYFEGQRTEFSLALDLRGTPFQRQVWEALRAIPFGQTASYGEIAKGLGNPQATRAVGAANGQNPVAIVVPCHRVVGANGRLTGFAGGLAAKALLLQLEQQQQSLELR